MTPEQSAFVRYVTNTLIPDLEESGMQETANDFIRLTEIIKALDLKIEVINPVD